MSRTTRRDRKWIFKSGCYGSGNVAVNLSGCSNVNSRTAEHSFGSTSKPAGFLQLFRIAEIHLLSLCLGTDSRESCREPPPCPLSLFVIRLSFPICSTCMQLIPPFPSPLTSRACTSSRSFSGLSNHSTNISTCDVFFLLWRPFYTPWSSAAANSNLQWWINLVFLQSSPFSSDLY